MTTVSRTCDVGWCEREILARGLCSGHYKRLVDGVDLEKPFRVFTEKTGNCRVESCSSPDDHRGMCKAHYSVAMKYNMSEPQIDSLLVETICRICRLEKKLVVDHDHSCCPEKSVSCGKCIRGMICSQCNSGLGYFQDNPEFLGSASRYLSGHLIN